MRVMHFPPVEGPLECAAGYKKNEETASYCEKCGYPFNSSEEEQQHFITSRSMAEIDHAEMNKKVKLARTTLLVLAGLLAISGFYFYGSESGTDETIAFVTLIVFLVLSFIYVGLSLLSKTRPLIALVTALTLFLMVLILDAIEDPTTLIRGFIFKGVIIFYLIKGVRSAQVVEKLKMQHNFD